MTRTNHGNVVGTPNITDTPISPEEVEEYMLFLFNSDKLKCEAKHTRSAKSGDHPTGPCCEEAEYRAIHSNHWNPEWHTGKNVCSEFVMQATTDPREREPQAWKFILI